MSTYKLVTPNGLSFRNDAVQQIVNNNAEVALYSGVIPGGQLGLINRMKTTLYMTLSTMTVLPGSLTFRIKYGTAVVTMGGGAITLLGAQANVPLELFSRLDNQNSLNNQFIYGKITQDSGGALSLGSPIKQNYTFGTIDSTVDQTFVITAQFQTANAANSLILQDFEMEIN